MAKNLFNLLSQEKDKHKILSRGMDVIYYFFIAFFLIYVLIKIYNFIYPTNKTSVAEGQPNVIEKSLQEEKENITSWLSKIPELLSPIIAPIKSFFSTTWSLLCWFISNPYRTLMLVILALFVIFLYYFRTFFKSVFSLPNDSSISGSIFAYIRYEILVLLIISVFLGVFGLFSGKKGEIKIKNAPKGYPTNGSFFEKMSWSLKDLWGYLIAFHKIEGALFCSLLILWFSFKYSSILFMVISALTSVFLFGKLFKCYILPHFKSDPAASTGTDGDAKSNKTKEPKPNPKPDPKTDKKDDGPKESVWFKILMVFYKIFYHIRGFFTNIYSSFTITNYYIKLLLLIEIIGILLYFIVPIAIKYIYTHNVSKKGGILDTQADLGIDLAIIENEKELNGLRTGLSVSWDEILSKGLYKENNNEKLEKYLLSLGFKRKEEQSNKLINNMLGRIINLETAIIYVQVNAPLIIELKNKIAHQKTTKLLTKEARKKENNIGKTKILLGKPIFTDTQKTIGTYKDIGDSLGTFNYNYAISSWFFIHNEPPSLRIANTKFTSLVNYSGRPNVLFNIKTNTLQITMKDTIDRVNVVYETDKIRLQRWNNIITNVNGGSIDIFLNGKLVSSTTNPVPFMSYDKITSGEDDGISGGICNVTYYPAPLSLPKIKLLYKSLKWKSPPII